MSAAVIMASTPPADPKAEPPKKSKP